MSHSFNSFLQMDEYTACLSNYRLVPVGDAKSDFKKHIWSFKDSWFVLFFSWSSHKMNIFKYVILP